MKPYTEIQLPKESANSYYMQKSKKRIEQFIYLDPEWYQKLFEPTTFYILGPKGCGKTLYAAYMCANIRNGVISRSYTVSVDDYGKLIEMKREKHLRFTDYATMWKVILIQKLLLGLNPEDISFFGRSKSYQTLQRTISGYFGYNVNDDSFNPTTVIDDSGKQTKVTAYLSQELELSPLPENDSGLTQKIGGQQQVAQSAERKEQHVANVYTDTWRRAIDVFKKTAEIISFKHSHYLFIDGLDVRPVNIPAEEYSACIGSLVRAVYELNTEIFGSMEIPNGHEFRIIALTRTDVFLNSQLVNVTSCINDNCVELDWTFSNENEFVYSKLYKMMNRLLGWDGNGEATLVSTYFGFNLPFRAKRPIRADLQIERLSRLRPRDIVVLFRLIQEECKQRGLENPTPQVFSTSAFTKRYAKYYTDQVKDEMLFTFSSETISEIFQILEMLQTDRFKEDDFAGVYRQYCREHQDFQERFPSFRDLIDVLYSLDVLGWMEGSPKHAKIHWHYREVKAIEESSRLPWDRFSSAINPALLIHNGASKHILG